MSLFTNKLTPCVQSLPKKHAFACAQVRFQRSRKITWNDPLNIVSKHRVRKGKIREWTPVPGLKRPKNITIFGHNTGGSRNCIHPDFTYQGVYTGEPEPTLSMRLPRKGGRCKYTGHVITRHRGGGGMHWKRIWRHVDYKRSILNHDGLVERVEYDPNRSGYLMLVRYPTLENKLQYLLAPHGMQPGSIVRSSVKREPTNFSIGNSMPLKYIPDRTSIYQIEIQPGKGGKLARAAGCSATLVNKNVERQGYALIRLPSKETRLIALDCTAVIGQVSNLLRKQIQWGKAGIRMKWGWRPEVKGITMNAVDHPHGGGTNKKRKHWGGHVNYKNTLYVNGQKTKRMWRKRLPRSFQMVVSDRLRYIRGKRGAARHQNHYQRWMEAIDRRKTKMTGVPDREYEHPF